MNAPGHAATILVVDDEPAVLHLAGSVLSHSGYRVLLAPDAETAWRFFERGKTPIHLVVSDITMPGMSGAQLVGRILQNSPATRAPDVPSSSKARAEVAQQARVRDVSTTRSQARSSGGKINVRNYGREPHYH